MKRLIGKEKEKGKDGKTINHMDIDTKGKAMFGHRILHMWWNDMSRTDWTKEEIIEDHERVVKALIEKYNINHNMKDSLDNTLSKYLKEKSIQK